MKTGKIGAIFLMSILALAGIGAGYAAWTDTITIDGTVNTGNVQYTIKAYSETWAYKDLRDPDERIVYFDNEVLDPGNEGLYPVANAVACEGAADEHDVVMTFNNVFPLVRLTADFIFHYDGSVPVKISEMSFEPIGTGYNFEPYLKYEAHPATWNEIEKVWDINYAIDVGLGYQLHWCDHVWVGVTLYVYNNIAEMQDETGSFGGTIELIQWNEYNLLP